MFDLYKLSLKRLLLNKLTIVILLSIFLTGIFLTFVMAENAQTKSSIPIGVMDLDKSTESEALLERIKEIPAFYVYEGTQEKLHQLLKEDLVQAVFIIKDGYENVIKSGKVKNLITLQYKDNNSAVKILSDIFAGEMLKNICLYKGYLLYEKVTADNREQIIGTNPSFDTLEQYTNYVEELEVKSDSFTFDMRVVDNGLRRDISGRLDNSLIYIQILSGILTICLSLFGLYGALPLAADKEEGIRKRLKIGVVRRSIFGLDLCTGGAVLSLLLLFNLIICVCFFFTLPGLTALNAVLLFMLLLLYSVIVVFGYLILGNLTGRVRKYEGSGIIFALVFGILGIGSTFSGFIQHDLLNISKLAPNSWFISGFIDIIVNTGLQDIPYMQFFSLGITGFSFFCILWLIDIRKHN